MGSACPPAGSVSRAARGRWFRLRPLRFVEAHELFTRVIRTRGDRRGAFTVNVRKVKLRRSVGLDEFAFFDISNLRHGAENEL